MSEPVGDELDQRRGFPELFEDQPHHLQIRQFTICADIIHAARLPFEERRQHGGAVIFHMNPVAHILAVAIDGQRLVLERVCDHERDQLLGKLIRSVVVRAARDHDLLPVGMEMRERQEVRRRLACGVG